MRRLPVLLTVATALVVVSCTSTPSGKACLDMNNLDSTAQPGSDFYQFASGGWQKANPIPKEYARFGTFDQLGEQNIDQIRQLIEELSKTTHEKGSVAQKIGDLYRLGMDSTRLNREGNQPIQPLLKAIEQLTDKTQMADLMAEYRAIGLDPLFGIMIGPDDKNSSMNILHLYQGGLGLDDRDYYLLQDEASKIIREGYIDLIQKQFVNAGFTPAAGKKAASTIMTLETALAKAHYTKEKIRLPELNYHKMTLSALSKDCGPFDWARYLQKMSIKQLDSLNVGQPEALTAAIALYHSTSIEDLKAYLVWNVINYSSAYLSDVFVSTDFDFYGRQMTGALELQPRWKRMVAMVEGSLGEAVGQMYVEKHFPSSSKKRMLGLVDNLRKSLGQRIADLDWMSDTTKAKAKEKLDAITVKIGYPDKWRDYADLSIEDVNFLTNIHRVIQFDYRYQLNKLGKPVDKTEWLMYPQTVNAYYNPSTNEICFPAGILQPPFFYADGDDAINYGAIGVVIGHEMTHGFDDQGRKYDKVGNMTDWWTTGDATRFEARTKVLVNHFDSIKVMDNLFANGTYTLGENIADYGGLQVAYHAFVKTKQGKSSKPIDGYTPKQRFFLSYSTVWAGNIRNEEIIRLTNLDVHSLSKWRVNGSLPHIAGWYEAFDIQKTDPLYLPVEKRVSIW